MRSRTKSTTGKRTRDPQRGRKSQPPKRAPTAKGIAPTFTAKLAEDGAYYVLMEPNAYAPAMHIGNFASKNEAQAWIRDEAAAWFAKLVAAAM
jgi:hypothetical protein